MADGTPRDATLHAIPGQSGVSFWPTPQWAADALVERYFGDLTMFDRVIDPGCGTGAFLAAIPDHVPALGIELDPDLAELARRATGREVRVGDFRTVNLPDDAAAVIGNPPFVADVIEGFLSRAHQVLRPGGRTGFLLPAYFLQTAGRVCGLARRWSVQQDFIPRNLFPRIKHPLCFAVFTKERTRRLVGFALYEETADVKAMDRAYQDGLSQQGRPVWKDVVVAALTALGGEAELDALYAEVSPKRPSANTWWKAKVRQTVQRHCRRTGPGRWALAA